VQLQEVALPQAVLRLLRRGAVLQPLHLPKLLEQGREPVRAARFAAKQARQAPLGGCESRARCTACSFVFTHSIHTQQRRGLACTECARKLASRQPVACQRPQRVECRGVGARYLADVGLAWGRLQSLIGEVGGSPDRARGGRRELVAEQREAVRMRNPQAFEEKIIKVSGEAAGGDAPAAQHKRGCHCKKSHCKKKYCECFQARRLTHVRAGAQSAWPLCGCSPSFASDCAPFLETGFLLSCIFPLTLRLAAPAGGLCQRKSLCSVRSSVAV